jgi:antitoxin component YwqK of YwqJK toxin-antitoxin module
MIRILQMIILPRQLIRYLGLTIVIVFFNTINQWGQCMEEIGFGQYRLTNPNLCDSFVVLYDHFSQTNHVFNILGDTIHDETVYYDNGVIQVIYPYKGNRRNSISNTYLYDRNGTRRGSNFFKNGEIVMIARRFGDTKWYSGTVFFDSFRKSTSGNFDSLDMDVFCRFSPYNDSLYFWSKTYSETAVQVEGNFIRNRPHGKFTTYYRNGQVRSALEFDNGCLKKIVGLYSSNGDTIKTKLSNINCKKSYTYLDFEDGSLFSKNIYSQIGFFENYRDGIYQEFFNKAYNKIKLQASYKKGIKDGEYLEYHPNGKIACIGKFKMGLASGIWKYYDQEGVLIFVTDYETGYP